MSARFSYSYFLVYFICQFLFSSKNSIENLIAKNETGVDFKLLSESSDYNLGVEKFLVAI